MREMWGWVHESTRGWDNDCGNGVGLGNFFKFSGVGNKLRKREGMGSLGNPVQAL